MERCNNDEIAAPYAACECQQRFKGEWSWLVVASAKRLAIVKKPFFSLGSVDWDEMIV